MRYNISFLTIILLLMSCQSSDNRNLLEQLLHDNKDKLGDVVEDPAKYEVQIIYTQIDRDANNTPTFTSYKYRVDSAQYFYPASTVKMPVALTAMEKLNTIYRNYQKPITKYTPLWIDSVRVPQTVVRLDSTAPNNLPTVAHYIKKIFTVSDNDANNRLYEFIGQDYLNNTLNAKGFADTRIVHRLGAPDFDEEANKFTNRITFYDPEADTTIYYQGEVKAQRTYQNTLNNTLKGVGYQKDGQLINEPFDFSKKNFMALTDFEAMMKAVMFPQYIDGMKGFQLTEEDYKYLYKCMSILPRESQYPKYDPSEYYDSYCKFFIWGDSKEPIPSHIRTFNKVGFAYGYLTDCSYIVDFEKGVEFLLTATIHVNDNQIYNDNNYEYDEIGMPFLANLGRIIYDYEQQRERPNRPDLSWFKINEYE